MNLETLIYNDLQPGRIKKPFEKVLEQLSNGDFASAEVKKMTGTGLYRARIDYENRLLFKFGRYSDLVIHLISPAGYMKLVPVLCR